MTDIGTVTIDRSSLPGSLADLVITTGTSGTYTLAQGGLGRPGVVRRDTFATDSPFVNGKLRTSSVKDEVALGLIVRVQSTTTSGLNTAVEALEAALDQDVYTVTVAVDGASKVWTASPASWGTVDGLVTPWRVLDHFEDLSISIPVYPVSV